jgi:hypothetical protein
VSGFLLLLPALRLLGQAAPPAAKLEPVRAIVEDFGQDDADAPWLGWTLFGPVEADLGECDLIVCQEPDPDNPDGLPLVFGQFDYDCGPEDAPHWMGARLDMPLPGKPVAVELLVCGDASGNRLAFSMGDSTGEWLNYSTAPVTWEGWKTVKVYLRTPAAHGGGDEDGKLDLPASLNSINIEPAGKVRQGTLLFEDIAVLTEIGPEDALYPRVYLREEDDKTIVQVLTTNLASTPQRADVLCEVLGPNNFPWAETRFQPDLQPGETSTDEIELPANQHVQTVSATITYPGGLTKTIEKRF